MLFSVFLMENLYLSRNQKVKKALGHDIEFTIGYTFAKFVTVGAGYTYMRGTETMQLLQRADEKPSLHWGWVMLTVNPTIFTYAWNDRKKG